MSTSRRQEGNATRYAWVVPIADRSAESVADALYDAIIRVHGAPEMIRTDNEKAFVGKLMTCLLDKWEIRPISTRAYHSEANGHVERFHRYLNELLTIECGKRNWIDGVKSVCFTYNNGCHSSTGYTPYYLMHGRHPALPAGIVEALGDRDTPTHGEYVKKLDDTLRLALTDARKRQETIQRLREARWNKRRRSVEFKKGDLIMLWEPNQREGEQYVKEALTNRFSGPHEVLRKDTKKSYVIAHSRRKKEVKADVKDMRPFTYHPFMREDDGQLERAGDMRVGDLCIVPIKTKSFNPFYVGRVTNVKMHTIDVQWYGNNEDDERGEQLPQWTDQRGDRYYAEMRDRHAHKPCTNATESFVVARDCIDVFEF